MKTKIQTAVVLTLTTLSAFTSRAELFRGVEFPHGIRSFADGVVSYAPGSPLPSLPHQRASAALGAPDSDGETCQNQETCGYVSLSRGGSIILQFTDNALTGSGSTNLDLWIFEVGADVEDTFVEISKDGSTWFSIGKVFGSTSGIDIDAFGFGPSDHFTFVRLTDDPNEGDHSGVTPGADIDAVGAISSTNLPPRLNIRVSQVELCWDTITNVFYQLQYREALATNTWLPFGGPMLGTGVRYCTNDSILPGQPQRFYRLVLTNAP